MSASSGLLSKLLADAPSAAADFSISIAAGAIGMRRRTRRIDSHDSPLPDAGLRGINAVSNLLLELCLVALHVSSIRRASMQRALCLLTMRVAGSRELACKAHLHNCTVVP